MRPGPVLALLLGGSIGIAPSPASSFPFVPDLQVNTYTTGDQSYPAVTGGAGGGFVVAWGGAGVFARRLDPAATPLAPQFQVSADTGYASHPAVAPLAAGGFVVVWEAGPQPLPPDGSESAVLGRRFDVAGTPLGAVFQVNTYTTGQQRRPAVAADANGEFVVVWQSLGPDGDGYAIAGRRFDAAGVPQGGELQVNTYTTSSQYGPAVAAAASGDFVVAWTSSDAAAQDGSGSGVFAQRFDGAGAPQGAELVVSAYTTGRQLAPAIAATASGDFVVTWAELPDLLGIGREQTMAVFARQFAAGGTPLGPDFAVSTDTSHSQNAPRIAVDGAGGFLVAWTSDITSPVLDGRDGSGAGVFAQRFDPAGSRIGSEFQVNAYTTLTQEYPAVAADGVGGFLVAWHSTADSSSTVSEDGSGRGVFAQRYACGNGVLDPGEGCDDGNAVAGDGCEPTCAPTGCGNGALDPNETCDDGNIANGDCCTAACRTEPAGSPCPNDDDECTLDQCDGAGHCGVGAPPAIGCFQPTRSGAGSLVMRASGTLVWRWVLGEATSFGDFGTPFAEDSPALAQNSTSYALCLYDASGGAQPLLDALAPSGGTCANGRPCWRSKAAGQSIITRVEYVDRAADPDGLTEIRLMTGDAGKSRVLLRGKGSHLALPALPLVPPVRIQLRVEDGACWEAVYSSPQQNAGGRFKARPD